MVNAFSVFLTTGNSLTNDLPVLFISIMTVCGMLYILLLRSGQKGIEEIKKAFMR